MAGPTPTEVKASYQRTLETVRADKGLSAEGKRQRIARAYQTTTDQLAKLSSAVGDAKASERQALEKKFIGPGSPGLGTTPAERIARDASFRDALDRASNAEQGDLQALLQRAKTVDDPLMVRAALTVAVERGDADAVNVWLEDQPAHVDRDMNRLWEIKTSGVDLAAEMVTAMEYGHPEVPNELAGLGPVGIANVAEASVSA